jgi:hypothetical protein
MTRLALLAAALLALSSAASGQAILEGMLPALFPADNWWNTDISRAPVDPGSAAFIAFIGAGRTLHPDFGGDASPPAPDIYGFPWATVGGNQPKVSVDFDYADESDAVGYPIPSEAISQPRWVEGGYPASCDPDGAGSPCSGDDHMLIVDRDNLLLYELSRVHFDGSRWHAGSGALFDLTRNARRPEGWTSADAAGLAILPGLVRFDEAAGPAEIAHALRVTVRATNGYVFPASHRAGGTEGALPMGARLRLKASLDLSPYPPAVAKIFRAMQRYGLIVADNGSDMFISGAYDTRWDNDVLNPAFGSLAAGDFDVIELGWQPAPAASPAVTPVAAPPATAVGGR